MKNNKGITLIALVITIIVLLILAGVTIAMLTGDNGLLTRASSAKTETSKAEVLDRVNMELNGQMANAMAGIKFDTAETIETNLGLDANDKIGDYTIAVSVTGTDTTAYATDNKVSIAITTPSGITLATSTGEVKYASNKWSITPVK